ncbi:MAG: hypothetical protein K8H86_03185 [Ignavibacteriaceae bacterium]|nr:hypothetical protein [Ignavibacteriaceae bacterium]
MKKFLLFFVFVIISLLLFSCYDNPADNPTGNLPPKTSIFLNPDSSVSSQPSRIHLHWSGDDPDGLIIGFYFSWDGTNWIFTSSNDSIFALQIGAVDTNYTFFVSAVDDGGNGVYDKSIIQNNINYGSEPFVDKNNNGIYDADETYTDIGLIDPNYASIKLPIKNSSPVISWNALSFVPDTSFPVMSFGWDASDLDGDNTIEHINIALNDTNQSVSINGAVRIVTLRVNNFANPLADILIDGNPNNLAGVKLPGMLLNAENKFYVQAVDISGAKSKFISLPGVDKTWYVKQPKSNFIIVDDYGTLDDAESFYYKMLDSLGLNGKYDVYNYKKNLPPYLNVTFRETVKLFKYVFWYSDTNPSLDLANGTTQKFLDGGGKIFFSMQFPSSVDLSFLQGFLPILADSSSSKSTLFSNVVISAAATAPEYPDLFTSLNIFRPRAFYLSDIGVTPVYYFPNNELKGHIGFKNSPETLFFIGLPLHRLNGGSANVKTLMNKVLLDDFGLTP